MEEKRKQHAKNEPDEPALTAHERALQRLLGIALAKGYLIFRVAKHDGWYCVSSNSVPDMVWLVDYDGGHPHCECEGYRFYGYCSHTSLTEYVRGALKPAALAEVTPLRDLQRPARKAV